MNLERSAILGFLLIILMASNFSAAVNTQCVNSPVNVKNGLIYSSGAASAEFYFAQKSGVTDYSFRCSGELEETCIMKFQRFQPQQFVYCGPGKADGEAIFLGTSTHVEETTAWDFRNLYNANGRNKLPRPSFTPAPFSAIILCASDAGDNFNGIYDMIDVWRHWHYTWVVFGPTQSISASEASKLAMLYAYYTVEFDEYISRAIFLAKEQAKKGMKTKTSEGNYNAAVGGYSSGYCTYEYTESKHSSENIILNKNEEINLEYTLGPPYYPYRTTNGYFIVLHGIIDNNYLDTDTGTISMKIEHDYGSGWVQVDMETYEIQNRACLLDEFLTHKAYGGSDICTNYVEPNLLQSVGDLDIKITIKFTSNQAQRIFIDRFELMEIQ